MASFWYFLAAVVGVTILAVGEAVNMVNGTVCFNCPDTASPGTCEKVIVCNYDETCLARLVLTELFQERYQLRCEKKHVCQDSVGRQFHGHPKSLLVAFGKRQFQFPLTECQYCCDDNFCNNKECVKGTHGQSGAQGHLVG
ncbi:uncharacterized protein LOC134282129 isoform X2 [Saccostrea cucullata]|uniref:uncharacterized protein LOC134282129 isoform X2 n=1 Tax=Saccostrea cuccullata TaxID=36930 RepID=UPI002ED53A45